MRGQNLWRSASKLATVAKSSGVVGAFFDRAFSTVSAKDFDNRVFYKGAKHGLLEEGIKTLSDLCAEERDLADPSFIPESGSVFRVKKTDIPKDKKDGFSAVRIFSGKGAKVSFGKKGVLPSSSRTVEDLLVDDVEISPDSIGVLFVEEEVPFCLRPTDKEDFHAISGSRLEKVLEYDKRKKSYSLNTVLADIPTDLARRLSIEIERKVFSDQGRESFYKETTLPISMPSLESRASATFMVFDHDILNKSKDKSTDMHHHPGDRVLLVIAGNRSSGVTLNFCGSEENPDERKDTEVNLKFTPNSISILKFPAGTHHKFKGSFRCISFHPEDGPNLIKSLQAGSLPEGFLESATVFSKTTKMQKEGEPSNSFSPSSGVAASELATKTSKLR